MATLHLNDTQKAARTCLKQGFSYTNTITKDGDIKTRKRLTGRLTQTDIDTLTHNRILDNPPQPGGLYIIYPST